MATNPSQRLDIEEIGDVTVVGFRDNRLDESILQVVGAQLLDLIDKLGRKSLLLNFGNVAYLSSAALGMFITLTKRVREAGGRLTWCNLSPQIAELFGIFKGNSGGDSEGEAGVLSRLKPPKPSGGQTAALRPPPESP